MILNLNDKVTVWFQKKLYTLQMEVLDFLKDKYFKRKLHDLEFPEEKLGQSEKPYVAGSGGGGWIFSGTYMLQYQLVKETLLIRSSSIYFNELECNQKSFEH